MQNLICVVSQHQSNNASLKRDPANYFPTFLRRTQPPRWAHFGEIHLKAPENPSFLQDARPGNRSRFYRTRFVSHAVVLRSSSERSLRSLFTTPPTVHTFPVYTRRAEVVSGRNFGFLKCDGARQLLDEGNVRARRRRLFLGRFRKHFFGGPFQVDLWVLEKGVKKM